MVRTYGRDLNLIGVVCCAKQEYIVEDKGQKHHMIGSCTTVHFNLATIARTRKA